MEYTNRLINEKSPYLLQHAHNPVDWYPWGEEAFHAARESNKPIFLSVGYSTCHWCHVMERESFENEEIADIMNKHFINIKVDREENPGVDKLYMTYVQLTSGGGGWPMSVFLTPDRQPFLGATYFPPEDRFGRPGFKTLLKRIAQLWQSTPDKLRQSGEKVIAQLKSYAESKPGASSRTATSWDVASETYGHFESSFDADQGGFGGAPKFPTPVQLLFLLDYYGYSRTHKEIPEHEGETALDMVLYTIDKIACGGIHDHVGSGFHRYSTDKNWHVPHFEKMLYDQAQLLMTYTRAYQLTGNEAFANVMNDIVLYVQQNLLDPQGAFYAAEDADSLPLPDSTDKKEGAFCVWEANEIVSLLGKEDASIFNYHYFVKEDGNVDPSQDPHNELQRKNVLMQVHEAQETADHFKLPVDEVETVLKNGRAKLLAYRLTGRPKPHRDDKILTSWNGLMISGLAISSQALDKPEFKELAIAAAKFIKTNLYRPESGVLLRSYREGPSDIEGFLDDYSYLIQGLLDLYEATLDEQWIEWAYQLQEKQVELFYDDNGGFFNVAKTDQTILVRLKEEQDGAEPSSNAVSLKNLTRLGTLLSKQEYTHKVQDTIEAFQLALTKFPFGMPAFVSAYLLADVGVKEILFAGENITDYKYTVERCSVSRAGKPSVWVPNQMLAYAQKEGLLARENNVVREVMDTQAVYICENFTCGLPLRGVDELEKSLREKVKD
ncbi:hypothetical protein BCR43DRAFT_376106 [Syncephalastrum racemosum]|uniref:Spermatogenesis-associated protein 20-like TRX domain-containing protein n=1 Tax=Syncephalastrum racemosum TaxID=13706 RepID=A0A1X2H4R1_SYNRA|nr:hypothetical protein BCR43DRAFT_376106 [Syncephalastrum racemosum]